MSSRRTLSPTQTATRTRRYLARRVAGPAAVIGVLGPGLIAASAGNDAGGIATYASVGASYGYSLLWVLAVITVSLAIIQEMAARMGVVTGKGFADLVRENLGLRTTAFVMLVLVAANGGLVVSEFAGIGAAAELLGISRYYAVPVMALLVWWLITRGSYRRVERVFLLMTLIFFAYPVAAFLAGPDWGEVGRSLVTPTFSLEGRYLLLMIALIGTTITPYMQIYAQSTMAERGATFGLSLVKLDAYSGALFSNVVAGFIIVATGATLHRMGVEVQTAQDAARALEPVAGRLASAVFAVGLLGASVLAAAVLPLSTAYTVCEAFGFERGVNQSFRDAPVFHGLFTALLAVGVLVALVPGLNVIQLLVWTQVINGLLLPVVLISILRLVNNPEVMGEHTNGLVYNVLAWATTGLVVLLSCAYLVITLLGIFGVS
ncbi:natural resistance-associated macrophage protein [Thermobaculum terrenum ATCC BAA-798]|uniref:Natural resistance-associated macrophage protein n=1 Tax=Thermobaculum terrenum (strain ATCC BAA-798 / CCMEE 7001 / YNP1) TaxID=525904 RepID=D1CHL7_THET1|nr:Nramp family divalent metal transporter [Thermobaculum terrenum]ACZ43238.1 natural resistance-associated macrophage protein [Thermobaculum terrenum ATCC BAA-798]